MAENTLKTERNGQTPDKGGKSLFSSLEQRIRLEKYFEDGFPVRHLPRVLFVFLLGLIYIGNTHYAERTTRAINKAQTEVEDLRADFTTQKAELMFSKIGRAHV